MSRHKMHDQWFDPYVTVPCDKAILGQKHANSVTTQWVSRLAQQAAKLCPGVMAMQPQVDQDASCQSRQCCLHAKGALVWYNSIVHIHALDHSCRAHHLSCAASRRGQANAAECLLRTVCMAAPPHANTAKLMSVHAMDSHEMRRTQYTASAKFMNSPLS